MTRGKSKLWWRTLHVVLSIAVLSHCGSDDDEGAPQPPPARDGSAGTGGATACVPGKQEPCACGSNVQGVQVCSANGREFGPCACGSGGASGGGFGGASGGGAGGVSGGSAAGGASGGGQGGTLGGGSGGSAGGGSGGTAGAQSDAAPDSTTDSSAGSVGKGDGASGTAGKGGGDGGLDASADAGGCPSGRGPTMVDLGGFCIDSTEVTESQYAAFITAKGSDTSGQPTSCAWNTSYAPRTSGGCTPTSFDPTARPNHPVKCVDWCDAYAYCAWAGKRLCGRVTGGPLTPGSALGAWQAACSSEGTRTYPYGNNYIGNYCVTSDYDGVSGYQPGTDVPRPVASLPTCEGGYPGIWDMSGNLYEWEDSCQTSNGAEDTCQIRGGSFQQMGATCAAAWTDHRDGRNAAGHIGIRCCAF
jgi:formylglycine-generating enzyme